MFGDLLQISGQCFDTGKSHPGRPSATLGQAGPDRVHRVKSHLTNGGEQRGGDQGTAPGSPRNGKDIKAANTFSLP